MDTKIIEIVLKKSSSFLTPEQILKVKELFAEEISKMSKREIKSRKTMLKAFITAKKVEGCSDRTIGYYKYVITKFISETTTPLSQITTEEIRAYINEMMEKKKVSNLSADNTRRILSSFFAWLFEEDYILKNPMKRIHKIKLIKKVKEAYSEEMVETIKSACSSIRDLAIIELLSSTGIRVGELVKMNKTDIDFNSKEIIVLGKGGKQRKVYFDTKTKLHLLNYLNSRIDKNEAAFVSLFKPFQRLQISGVEILLRKIGRKTNIEKVHPHRFRRTLATKAIDKGMPIEQVQTLLGHAKIDTTLHYAIVEQTNVKNSYHRYLE